ncbi:MAG: methyltransferase domain-containing protein [Bacteroidota bacterium]
MNRWKFFREAMRSWRSTGAIASSSPALVKRLVAPISDDRPLKVVELGPGDGCVTQAILERLHPDSELIAFEINHKFIERLREIEDARLRLIPQGAERLAEFIEPESIDYVVSSLPLSIIPKGVKAEIIQQSMEALKPQGHYLQFQYALQDYKLLKYYFNSVKVSFTAANLPPAFIYTCSLGLAY